MPPSSASPSRSHPTFFRLQTHVAYLIEHARTTHPLGIVSYTPAAFGEFYKALYLRDFTYMAESAPEFIPAEHVRAVIDLLIAHLSPEGLCPERISNEGEVIYICHGGKPVTDSPLFLVKLCAAYARQNPDPTFIARVFPALARTVATTPVEAATGLVWIDPATPHTAYGFTDTIAITGRHFFCSLLLFEAYQTLARFAAQLGRTDEAARYTAQMAHLKENLTLLWSPEHQLYLAGSRDGAQADVWGSAYACTLGILDQSSQLTVAQSLWAKRDRFIWRGQVRHLLQPESWRRLIVDDPWTAPGKFQNGAYWGTATGWMAEAFETAQPGAGLALLCDLVTDFEQHGIWECIGPDGYTRAANNVSSACLPYASWKKRFLLP